MHCNPPASNAQGIGCTKEIQDFFRTNPLGYGATYQAHPVPTACAYEVVKYTIEQDIVGQVQVRNLCIAAVH